MHIGYGVRDNLAWRTLSILSRFRFTELRVTSILRNPEIARTRWARRRA